MADLKQQQHYSEEALTKLIGELADRAIASIRYAAEHATEEVAVAARALAALADARSSDLIATAQVALVKEITIDRQLVGTYVETLIGGMLTMRGDDLPVDLPAGSYRVLTFILPLGGLVTKDVP